MAPLLLELSSLEIEPVEIVVNAPESEQESSLNTLSAAQGDLEVLTALTGKSISPANSGSHCGPAIPICCCCCPCCCC
jgi:hypothetical protein